MPEISDNTPRPLPARRDAPCRDAYRRTTAVQPNQLCHSSGRLPRARISFHDADRVTLRLSEAGRAASLAGIAAEVLAAVVDLLPRWTRIRDDRIRLRHITELCPSRPHARSVGRALARLDGLDIVRYSPARGRGTTATVAVHERLLAGIAELDRDDEGRVVVPFSRPDTSSCFRKNPPTPHQPKNTGPAAAHRPTEVDVAPEDVGQVLADMPTVFQALPPHLRWLLGKAVRRKLARGYLPEQIVAVLAAPLPAGGSRRPFKLAIWRLTANQPGAGPRLAGLQRSWDRRQADQQRREHRAAAAAALDLVQAITTPGQRTAMIAAIAALFGPVREPAAALLTASRRAQRQYPDLAPGAAIAAWLTHGDHRRPLPVGETGQRQFREQGDSAVSWLAGPSATGCVSCGQPGSVRLELPLRSVVCDRCLAA